MRIDLTELRNNYAAVQSRGSRIEWLLNRRDQLTINSQEAFAEFMFISEEVCKLLGARICLLATKEELASGKGTEVG